MDNIPKIKSALDALNADTKELYRNDHIPGDTRDMVLDLTAALTTACEALKYYHQQDIKVAKTPCGTGLMHPLATEALEYVAAKLCNNTADGEGK